MKRIILVLAAIVLIAIGVVLSTRVNESVKSGATASKTPEVNVSQRNESTKNELTVLCPAGLRKPVETCAAEFTAATGIQIRLQYAGSGQLIAQLTAGAPADIFVPADGTYLQLGRDKKLLREAVPLAEQHPVIAVRSGNPKAITGLDGLLAPGIRFALANPEAASIGRTVKEGLKDRWTALAAASTVTKMTVTDLLNDVQIGSVDAAIVWNSTVHGVASVAAVEDETLARLVERPIAAVTESCKTPANALAFIRWMASPEHGNPAWQSAGFNPIRGDAWSPKPSLTFYCGSVNRIAIQTSLKEFAEREGVEVNTVYNGCGILCASMKQMADDKQSMPDAYYACDICFVPPVAEHFPEAFILTEAAIVIAVPKGNPKNIKTLEDLARPGLKIGIGNAKQSTLGYMTSIMLGKIRKTVEANAVSQVPQGDLLVTQLRTGSIDAAIVYNTNARPQAEFVDIIPLYVPGAKAMQPFAVGKDSPNAQLAGRMLDYLRANKERFVDAGFVWHGNQEALKSSAFSTNPADANRP